MAKSRRNRDAKEIFQLLKRIKSGSRNWKRYAEYLELKYPQYALPPGYSSFLDDELYR